MLKSERQSFSIVSVCLFLMLTAMTTTAQPPVNFTARRDFPTRGLQTQSIVSKDFDRDGKLDLITVNARSFDVTVHTGLGDGTFRQTGGFFVGGSINRGPVDLDAADFNGDGRLDLAVAVLDGTVSVLVGNGNGTFQTPISLGAGILPQSVKIDDFDGDGQADIATVNFGVDSIPNSSNVSVLLGNGNGTFRPAVNFGVGNRPFDLAAGDFNGDAKRDVAVTYAGTDGADGGISLLLGNGNGTFQTASTLPGISSTLGILAGDFNNDGQADLAATVNSEKSGALIVLAGNGKGAFTEAGNYPVGAFCLSIIDGDLNGDGRGDLATVSRDKQEIAVLFANGQGAFQKPVKYVAGRDPLAIVTGDFDGDRNADLATANFGSNSISVLLGKGAGEFVTETNFAAGGTRPNFAVAADFNRDCRMDLATVNHDSNNISVLLGNGNGSFQTPLNFAVGTQPFHMAVGDFNGDAAPDLAVANSGVPFSEPGGVSILLGNGNGTFRPALNFPTADAPIAISVNDFNRDARADLAVVNFRSNSVSILLGQGNGNFQAAPPLIFPTLSGLTALGSGDFNGDGNPDLEVVSTFQSTVFILLGQGNGTFRRGKEIVYPVTRSIGQIIVTDLNNDGRLDLVGSNGIVLIGNGDATFQSRPEFVSTAGETIAAADLNGDGFMDLTSTGGFAMRISIFVGNGDGSFQPEIRFGAGGFPSSILAEDLTGDSKPDLVTANGLDNITLIPNRKLLWKTRRKFCRL